MPGFYTLVVGSSGYTLSPLFARMLAEQMTSGTTLPPSTFRPRPSRRAGHLTEEP